MDTIRKITREYRASEWAKIVKTCRSSGQTVRGWCADNNVRENSFYYWQRRFREQACEAFEQSKGANLPSLPTFAEINLPQRENPESIAVTLRIGETTAEIHNGADPATIESVIRILKTLC